MNYVLAAIGGTAAVIVGVLLISVVATVPMWLLWNWLMPVIFGLTKITIFQAWGLVFLCNLLFKNSTGSSNA